MTGPPTVLVMGTAQGSDLLRNRGSNSHLISCDNYHAVTRGPLNQWTANQRVVLAYLASFDIAWREKTRIFNAFFRDEMPTESGLTQGAVNTMWHSMTLLPDEEAALSKLKGPCSSAKAVSFERLTRTLLERIANDLGIDLVEKKLSSHVETTRTTTPSPVFLKKRKLDDIDVHAPDRESRKTYSMTQSPEELVSNTCPQTPEKILSPYPHDPYPTPPTSGKPVKRVRFTTPVSPSEVAAQLYRDSISSDSDTLAFRAFSERSHGINTSDCLYASSISLSSYVGFRD